MASAAGGIDPVSLSRRENPPNLMVHYGIIMVYQCLYDFSS